MDKKITEAPGYAEDAIAWKATAPHPAEITDGSVYNKHEKLDQSASLLPGIGGGNKGKFMSPSNKQTDPAGIDELL